MNSPIRLQTNEHLLRNAMTHHEQQLQGADKTIRRVINTNAANIFGDNALLNPSDIEITPVFMIDEPVFTLRAWHETGDNKNRGILQMQNLSFRLKLVGEDMFMAVDNDDSASEHKLSTLEAIVLRDIGNTALATTTFHEMFRQYDQQDES